MSWTRQGVRYRKVESRGGRWSGPKVHLTIYDSLNKEWQLACRRNYWHGYPEVDDMLPVTCKLCASVAERVEKKR